MSDADDRLAHAARRTGRLALWLWAGTPTIVIVLFGWLGVASDARLKFWLVAVLLLVAVSSFPLMRALRCPRCAQRVLRIPDHPGDPWPFAGRRWSSLIPPRRCPRCGLSFVKRQR